MRLLGQEFGWAFCASGARNIDGNGYPFHQYLKPFGLRYEGSTLITKTVTVAKTDGNMPLKADGITPQEKFPRCIYVDHWNALTLNAVSLSNCGFNVYLDRGTWHSLRDSFVISFMAVGKTLEECAGEDCQFVDRMRLELPKFNAPVAIERNFSCPNVDHNTTELEREVEQSLSILDVLDRPIIVKLTALVSPKIGVRIAHHPACAALCMSNTIPFGELPSRIPWKKFFPDGKSPLHKRGFKQAGGLGGAPLLPIVCDWISESRRLGLKKPIIACGGILCRADVRRVRDAGASAIEIGSASILRFWRVQGMIREANRILPSAEQARVSTYDKERFVRR